MIDVSITFQGIAYPVRCTILPDYGQVLVSITELSKVLLDENYNYISMEAQNIDEQIFFFVEDNDIDLPEKQFKKLIIDSVI